MTAPQEQLLLSLAHESLAPQLLSALIERTREECESMLPFDSTHPDFAGSWEESKEEENPSQQRPVQHLMLAGSSYMMKPGKDMEEWETAWTPGEQILGSVIDKIGLNKFHRRPTGSDAKRTARLIDVNPARYNNDKFENALHKQLEQIATQTSNNLKLDNSSGIQRAVVLLPCDERFHKKDTDDLKIIAKKTFERCWQEKDGPLRNAEIEIKLVSANV